MLTSPDVSSVIFVMPRNSPPSIPSTDRSCQVTDQVRQSEFQPICAMAICLLRGNLEVGLPSGLGSVEVVVSEAYIVGAVRAPVGRRNGGLASVHPVDLAAHVLAELIARTGADPAGVESMSQVPMGTSVSLPLEKGMAFPFGQGWRDRYGGQEISQFRGAQLMCEKWGIKRHQLEEFALESHARAVRAIDAGRFTREIAPVNGVTADEGPRRDTSLEKMAELKPLREGWEVTAAAASQISDGAAALLIASPDAVRQYGFTPRARIHSLAVTGADPVLMLAGPILATEQVLAKGHLGIDDIDVFEVNEAFAPVLLAWSAETGASLEKANPNGGAIALGHPLGATGAILMTKLLHELERGGGRYGLQTMCEGGGQANATIIERLA